MAETEPGKKFVEVEGFSEICKEFIKDVFHLIPDFLQPYFSEDKLDDWSSWFSSRLTWTAITRGYTISITKNDD